MDTNELAAALATAQGLFTNPPRNRTVKVRTKAGPEYTFSYATLDCIMDMIREPLASNGLAISHIMVDGEKGWVCITRLLHSSGQSIDCPVPVLVDEAANAQGWGSAITYARRYGICALLSIAADEDDDGNSACANTATQAASRPAKAAPPAAGKDGFGKATKPPPAAAPTWSTMTPSQRLAYTKARVAQARGHSDPVQSIAKIKEIASKLKSTDFDDTTWPLVCDCLQAAEDEINAECQQGDSGS